jgi:hypothetical protein
LLVECFEYPFTKSSGFDMTTSSSIDFLTTTTTTTTTTTNYESKSGKVDVKKR